MEVSTDETWLVDNLYDVRAHGAKVCEHVRADQHLKAGNFSIVSFSMGGMMARYLIEYCPLDMPIRNVVTLGAPLNGISGINGMTRTSFLGKIADWFVDKLIKFKFMERVIEPADYWRDPTDPQGFLDSSRFLAEANNEVNFDEERRFAWTHINKALFIKWSEDDYIVPKVSAWWGQYDENYNELQRDHTNVYSQDLIGLRTLEQNGKSIYKAWPGNHMQFNYTQINDDVLPVLRM